MVRARAEFCRRWLLTSLEIETNSHRRWCLGPGGRKDWASTVGLKAIKASELKTTEGADCTLADVARGTFSGMGAGSSTALGSGVFGNVSTYHYHGAAVAVKQLKAGVDEESIGEERCR